MGFDVVSLENCLNRTKKIGNIVKITFKQNSFGYCHTVLYV